MFLLFAATFLVLWGLIWFVHPHLWRGLGAIGGRIAALSMRSGRVQRLLGHSSPWRDYLPIVVIVAVGALFTGVAAEEFVDLAELLHHSSPELRAVDQRAHDWAVQKRRTEATIFFDLMSLIGGPGGLIVIIAVVAAAHALRHRIQRAGYLVVTTAVGGLINRGLKLYFARDRPEVSAMLRHASGYSFPSGHAMGSTIAFAALGYLAFRALHDWRWRSAAIALAITMVVSVALSRVYLGVHWISDVGAGVVAGVVWVTLATVAYEGYRRVRLIRAIRVEKQRSEAAG